MAYGARAGEDGGEVVVLGRGSADLGARAPRRRAGRGARSTRSAVAAVVDGGRRGDADDDAAGRRPAR